MRGAIVYKSKYGNARKIAESIAKGLIASGFEIKMVPIADVDGLEDSTDFLVVGGYTRMGKSRGKIKRWARQASKVGFAGKRFATFSTGGMVAEENTDTKAPMMSNRQAAEDLYEILQEQGLVPIAPPFKAGVTGTKGPLVEGDKRRAEEFGRELAGRLAARP